ncbi:hypothetical protein [Pontibacter akesuensis]|uniref:Uncharacterized protein n=1 Tax=Pontibacter akesuensis TaxID=388950 RepID=A0A1I7H6G8_9BACT|nr:hypothetical protein [Pontibacter akesuensis]GHA53085.1 hypothetical protein GCM10007389_00260 [Pontibacter akesuensis]SFU56300.1 hypothetical protein SAMN04487941_1555 [Pontibacter akesuensis]
MKTTLPWIVAALFLFLALYFYWQKNEAESQLALADNPIAEVDRELEDQTDTMDLGEDTILPPDTTDLVPPGGAAFVDELGSLSQSDVQRLQQKGLESPEANLKNDLNSKQRQLIPAEGTMGGTMAIRDSRILNDRYAMAYYEDGHSGGYMLLKYTVSNGTINWTVVDNSKL